jgi:hypothetical protein
MNCRSGFRSWLSRSAKAALASAVVIFGTLACGPSPRRGGDPTRNPPISTALSAPPQPSVTALPGSGRPAGTWTIAQSGDVQGKPPWHLWMSRTSTGGTCLWLDLYGVYTIADSEELDGIANCAIGRAPGGFFIVQRTDLIPAGGLTYGTVDGTFTSADAVLADGETSVAQITSGTAVFLTAADVQTVLLNGAASTIRCPAIRTGVGFSLSCRP